MNINAFTRFLSGFVGALLLVGMTSMVGAGDSKLSFPTTEEEITDVIRHKTIRTRGLRGVADVVEDRKVGAIIHFDLNSAEIKPESYKLLDEFGKAFSRGLVDERFVVAGHTDTTGSDEYNHNLSIRRARAVAFYLIGRHQLDESRFSIEGYGEQQPIADNNTSSGRAKNRRVEFVCK